MSDIEEIARTGIPQMRGLTLEDMAAIFDELQLNRIPTDETIDLDENFEIESEVILGSGRDVKYPMILDHPLFIDLPHISNINKAFRVGLAYGACRSKTPINIGEGILPEEKHIETRFNCNIIQQWSPSRIGFNSEALESSKAFIIDMDHRDNSLNSPSKRISENSKKHLEILEVGVHSPPYHLDMESKEDLIKHVELLREATDHQHPVMIKIPSSGVYENTKAALEAEADAVLINTSIDPFHTIDSISGTYGASILGSLPPALKAFKAASAKNKGVKLLITGGFRNGADIIKTLALGADAVGICESAVVAMGCNLCGECHLGNCSKGIASKIDDTNIAFNWKSSGKKLANYLNAVKLEIELHMSHLGVKNLKELRMDHVMALTYDSAAITGAKLIGYDRELPMWFH